MTTADDFIREAQEALRDKKFVAAVQREPYMHYVTPTGEIKAKKTVGGVSVLLDGILRKTGGLMVAIGSGEADQASVDAKGRVAVPPSRELYTLKRIFLTKKETDRFYYGFANQTLWPLCHTVFVKPVFRSTWWHSYVQINRRMARAILEELNGDDAFVWVNDYQFALVPKLLREKRPNISIGIFWHIPWPTPEIFRVCPWRHEILEGLLGADFIGFHRQYHVENFIDCLKETMGVIVESEPRSVLYKKRLTKMAPLPAGIDVEEIDQQLSELPPVNRGVLKEDLGLDLKSQFLMIGVDRTDYIKGLLERMHILDRFFEKYPQYIGEATCLSLVVPSRTPIPAYRTYNSKVRRAVERLNDKYRRDGWQPVHYMFVDDGVDRDRLLSYFQLADVGLVTSIDDGMNLVAKEFVISTKPDKGMLVLSRFAGAARDLNAAIQINPYDSDASADALKEALEMPAEEKLRRNQEMRRGLEDNTIYRWGIEFIKNSVAENLTHKYL